MARGFQLRNKDEVEYNYAPVVRISTIRMLLEHSVQNGYMIYQMDIPSAFLDGILNKNAYLLPPEGVKVRNGNVLKLKKGLYGLKQSPMCWNERFNNFMLEKGFIRSRNDFCLYSKEGVWVILYVDDILITGKLENIKQIMGSLIKEFC